MAKSRCDGQRDNFSFQSTKQRELFWQGKSYLYQTAPLFATTPDKTPAGLLADIYNAQMSGNQIVYLYDTLTTITYRVNYCFIDSQGYMCILACAQHFDGDAPLPIENRFSDYLYVKTRTHGATSMQLYTKSQDSGGGGGGDSSVMKVTLTYNSSTRTYSSDKTYAEVTAAYNAGKDIICDASGIIYRLDNVGYSSISFTRTTVSDNGDYNTWTHEVISVNSINSWTRTQIENDM